MFKPCPNCGFLVALIAGREASQRCPRCGSALVGENDTLDAPVEAPPRRRRSEMADASASARKAAFEPDDADSEADNAHASDASAAGAPLAAEERTSPIATPLHDAADGDRQRTFASAAHEGPSFVRRRRPSARAPGRRWPAAAGVIGLALLLASQLLLSQRIELARDARWRPLLITACGVLGCDVPAWREPSAWRMLSRGVRPDPKRPGVLHVTTTVRNDADWPQAPPVVVLSLSDVDGRLVGMRSVAPSEYGAARPALIAPGQSLDVGFDVREPAGRVESFDFRLR